MKKIIMTFIVYTLTLTSFLSTASNSTPSAKMILDEQEVKFMREVISNPCSIDNKEGNIILLHVSNQEYTIERILTAIIPSIFNLSQCDKLVHKIDKTK